MKCKKHRKKYDKLKVQSYIKEKIIVFGLFLKPLFWLQPSPPSQFNAAALTSKTTHTKFCLD